MLIIDQDLRKFHPKAVFFTQKVVILTILPSKFPLARGL